MTKILNCGGIVITYKTKKELYMEELLHKHSSYEHISLEHDYNHEEDHIEFTYTRKSPFDEKRYEEDMTKYKKQLETYYSRFWLIRLFYKKPLQPDPSNYVI